MSKTQIGKKAPEFKLSDAGGKNHSLSDFIGKRIVLYFYPKDNTPGCTREACAFRDHHAEFSDFDAVVIGVSKDSPQSHAKFIRKYDLPFLLLADPDHAVAEKYGAWGEKKNYGKTTMGTIRSTFIIDAKGVVTHQWNSVKVDGHAEQVLAALKG